MQMTNTFHPDWLPYAKTIIARLLAAAADDRKAAQDLEGPAHIEWDTSHNRSAFAPQSPNPGSPLLDHLRDLPDVLHLPPDVAHDIRDVGGDPAATRITGETRPGRRLPTRELSLALRMAATYRNQAALTSQLQPGAIGVLSGMEPRDLGILRNVLTAGMLPEDIGVLTASHLGTAGDSLCLLSPHVSDGEIAKSAGASLHRDIERAVEGSAPIIILLPLGVALPEAIRQGITDNRTLAPLSREILIAHLRHSHSATGRIDEESVRAALPDDRRVASLDSTMLVLALRAPTARAVAERIAMLTKSRGTGAPRLDDMAGNGPALVAARRIVADLQAWQQGQVNWSDLSRSLLLYGPPGTGKTWLARAMGSSAGISVVTGSFAEWQAAGHLGDMLREMRKSFAEAKRLAPALLIIDEIDAVGSRTGGDRHGSNYRMQVINAFLAEMDTIARDEGVIVVGTCNHPQAIDPAVLRAGRFDLKIELGLPDADVIASILRRHLTSECDDTALDALARSALGHSAADIDAAIRAARSAARHEGTALNLDAIRKQLGINQTEKKQNRDHRVAIHECGHAIACVALDLGRVERILITPTGGEIHRARPDGEGRLSDIMDEIAYLLAGRSAERLILGEVSVGAGGGPNSDLAIATRLALSIETTLGLGASGLLWDNTPDHDRLRDPTLRRRVQVRLAAAEQLALMVLSGNRHLLVEMAQALLEQRALSSAEADAWLSRVPRQTAVSSAQSKPAVRRTAGQGASQHPESGMSTSLA